MLNTAKNDIEKLNQAITQTTARLQELTILKMEVEKKKPHLIRVK